MRKKIFTLGVILFSGLNLLSVRADTGIPYLPQANDFGGVIISNLDDFYPSNGDYTLEVDAVAGTEIIIAGGIYRYTPSATGKVRFAQKDGVIYVYEGTLYKTSLEASAIASFPDIHGGFDDVASKTGIYSESNLLKNPGFETLGANLGDNAYKAVDWECNGYDYGSKSRARLNISELVGSEGSATFMLHGYGSPAEYLAQKLGGLKAKTYYKVVFTTWSHNNTDNGAYNIAVGNAIGDASVASSTFSSGVKGYLEMTQEFTFYSGENALTDAYLTITRTSTAITHFDRMTMVEGVTPGTATEGASNVLYFDGKAYSPEFELQEGEYFDMVTLVTNPNFDVNVAGWTTTTGAQNSTIKSGTSSDHPGGAMAGSNFWENWKPSPMTGKMYQVLEGVPNGKYELTLSVFSNAHTEDGHPWLYVYANDWETPVTTEEGATKIVPVDISVIGYATTGKLEIGMHLKEAISQWVGLDNARLKFFGYDPAVAVNYLQNQIQLISDTLVGKRMNNTVHANLTSAISTATGALSSTDEAILEAATLSLAEAADSAVISVDSYVSLKNAIDKANAGKSDYAALSGYNAYVAVINTIDGEYEQKDLDNNGVIDAIAELEAARKKCLFTQVPPLNCTFAIGNPSFEEGTTKKEDKVFVPNFWNLEYDFSDGSKDVVLHDTISHDGKYNLNIWSNKVQYIDLYQEILLPAGEYTLTAYLRTEAILNDVSGEVTTKVTDQHIYYEEVESGFGLSSDLLFFDEFVVFPVKEWETHADSWVELTVSFELDEEKWVRIGARSNGDLDEPSSKGWFQVDDFRLEQTDRPNSSITLINTENKELIVTTSNNGIVVSAQEAAFLSVYSITGQLIHAANIDAGDTFIALPKGVYIVNKTKIVVK